MPAKPILDDLELQQVQNVEAEESESVSRHSVPGLEGDFLQDLGRRAVRITLNGVLTGPDAGDGLKHLREKFQTVQPVSFVNDIATATSVDKVLIEALDIRERAGKPERFEYGIAIREFIPPPPPQVVPPPPPPPPPPPTVDKATLVVEVIVDGQPNFDFSTVTVTATVTQADRTKLNTTLTKRQNNQFTEENLPAGQCVATATVSVPSAMTGAASGALQAGQTTKLTIHLVPGVVIAQTFIVHFALDKAFVEPCMRQVLRDVSDFARNNPTAKLLIVGNTDLVGSPAVLTGQDPYNQSLSERRGRSVYAFLTFNRDAAGATEALTEWKELRKAKKVASPTINDDWGLTQVQHMLQDLDFYPGRVDGQDGPLTREGIHAFRCHVGLPPGNTMDDQTWEALIQAYLGKDPQIVVPTSQYFTNCPGEIIKWTGVASQDPVENIRAARRRNRRVELLFVHVDKLPCTIPQPDTFDLPTPGAVNSKWCVGDGDKQNRTCFVVKHLPEGGQPTGNEWLRQPAQPGTITVKGTITFDDGTPYAKKKFALIAPDGLNEQDENGSTGKPVPGKTKDDGTFEFPKMPVGWYSVEVQNTTDVLVRLKEKDAATATGPSVCKFLQSDTDSLDVVILSDPVLREIRLPVVAHLMTALHPLTRAIRTCPSAAGPPAKQATAHTDDEIRTAFATANDIWRPARTHFELTDIVHETYAFRTECEIDDNEFGFLLDRANDSFPQVVNVFFVGDLAGTAEAGFAISVEDGASLGIAGCAVGDRFQFTALGPPLNVALDADQTAQVLAHELGHYLSLSHADDTAANANRLMLPGTAAGENRTLTADEVKKARASQGANDDCVPLTLKVTGATTIGGSLSNRFIVIQGSPGSVTVDAQIPDRMLDPTVGSLTMTGGDPGANDKQRTVSTANNTTVDVVATYTPAGGGAPVTRHDIILVSAFTLTVDGATQVGGPGSTVFVAGQDPNKLVTVTANLDPAPFAIPSDLIQWQNGVAADDPQRRTVSQVTTGDTVVSATVAGVTRSVTIRVVVVPLLTVDSPFVVVKKPHTKPARRIITLKTSEPSTLTGTLTKGGPGPIQIFTTATGTTQVTFNGTDNVFTGAQLGSSSGVQLFAESTSPSTAAEDYQLTLGGSSGAPPATIKLTAVEITLDVAQTKTSAKVAPPVLSSTGKIEPGAFVIVQDAGFTHERAPLIVQPPKPAVTLTLRLEAFNASVQAFTDENAAVGQVPVPNPDPIPTATVPATGARFFAEGKSVSSAFFDTGFRLGIDGLETDADHVVITVLPDPSLPGPFAVGEHEYTRTTKLAIPAITETLSDLTRVDPGFGPPPAPAANSNGAFDADIHALVRYPAAAAGVDKPVSGVLSKYPLVVIAHGNHGVFDATGARVESFRGLEYVARHLASYGYIAISVDLDSMNLAPFGTVFPGIIQRGLVILEHIAFWKDVLNAGDPIFAGKFDDKQIGLIGHSRGGEAVVSAQKTNIDAGKGLNIKAVVSISQTDFLGIVHSTTPYLVIYGSADGDVSIGWPFRLYDRASPFKALVFVYGANHNRFSTSPDWLANLDLSPAVDVRIISEADHLNVAKGYSLGFLQLILRNVGDHILLFKKNLKPSAISAGVEIHNQVQDAPPRLTVDDFEQGAFAPAAAHGAQLAARATTNTLGQAVSQAGLAVPAPPATNPALNSLSDALTEGSLRHRDLDFFWNDTFGEILAWDTAGANYTQALGTKDVSAFDVLSFRVTQRFGVPRNPAPPAPSPDFSVALTDTAGQTAVVPVGSISAIPVPYNRVDIPAFTKSALTTIRMPLASFTTANAALDLKNLATIVFQFVQTAQGEIAIDDLEFSN